MTGTPDEKYFEEYIERYLTSQPITTISGDRLDRMEYQSVSLPLVAIGLTVWNIRAFRQRNTTRNCA